MKKTVLAILFVVLSTILIAQNKVTSDDIRPENNISLNLLGDASIISLNYERLFLINSTFFLTGKLGLGYNEEFELSLWGTSDSEPVEKYLTIPHHITGNYGKGRRCFEFGLGGTIINGNTTQHYLTYAIIGYRVQPFKSRKTNFRIFGNIRFASTNTDDILFIPFGLSFGHCF